MGSFGDELRRLRKQSGHSQETLAHRAGLSPEAVSLLERGRRTPRATTMQLLAEALELSEADRRALFATSVTVYEPRPLPRFVDGLIGREAEVAEVARLLADPGVRMVTLTGPGGVGKTRVALEAAVRAAASFPDRILWLPAGGVSPAEAIVPAAAAALGVRALGGATLEAIGDHLRAETTLLVIENAEQSAAAIAELCTAILTRTAGVTILVTSRQLVRVPGETMIIIDPLGLPPKRADLAALQRAPASALFLRRAPQSNRPDPTPEEVLAIRRICHRLDGLPLAIELAAARTSVLTVTELADELDRTLGILQPNGSVDLVDATVGWSYQLLGAREQVVLVALSVFAGRFTVNAVRAVVAPALAPAEVLDVLAALMARSLLSRVDDTGDVAQFKLLQVIRAFGATRLEASGEAQEVRRRHAHHFAAVVEQAAPHLTTRDQDRWLSTLERVVSDIRQAVLWSAEHDPYIALTIVGAMWRWCYLRGRYSEGRVWAEAALAAGQDAPPAIRGPALAGAGMLAFLQCDYDLARARIEECLAVYEESGDVSQMAWALARLGSIARERADYVEARSLHQRAYGLAVDAGDDHEAAQQLSSLAFVGWLSGELDDAERLGRRALEMITASGDREGIAWTLINLGATARGRGDLAGSEILLRQSLEICEEIDYREGIAWCFNQHGILARASGQLDLARGLQQTSLDAHRELGDRWRMASVIEELAALSAADGDPGSAATRLGTAAALRDEIGAPVPLVERPDRDATEAAARRLLGASFDAAFLAGRTHSVA